MSKRPWFIYTLADPRTGEVRYVGQTTDPKARLGNHRRSAGKQTHGSSVWLGELLATGSSPVFTIRETGSGDNGDDRERWWIAELRKKGAPLTNHEAGGRRPGPMSAHTKQRIAAATRGKSKAPDAIEATRRSHLGRKYSAEVRARMSAGQRGRTATPETRKKLSDVRKGHHVSDATRAKISEAKRGKPRSPETVAKMAAAFKGRKLSEETKAKKRASIAARKARERNESTAG